MLHFRGRKREVPIFYWCETTLLHRPKLFPCSPPAFAEETCWLLHTRKNIFPSCTQPQLTVKEKRLWTYICPEVSLFLPAASNSETCTGGTDLRMHSGLTKDCFLCRGLAEREALQGFPCTLTSRHNMLWLQHLMVWAIGSHRPAAPGFSHSLLAGDMPKQHHHLTSSLLLNLSRASSALKLVRISPFLWEFNNIGGKKEKKNNFQTLNSALSSFPAFTWQTGTFAIYFVFVHANCWLEKPKPLTPIYTCFGSIFI